MTTPHIAFDPLNETPLDAAEGAGHGRPAASRELSIDSEDIDTDGEGLSLELLLSLESSLEALARVDAAADKADDTEIVAEQFDLDEVDSEEGVVSRRYKGEQKMFSFNLRNVVVTCGLVLGGFALFWTHDLFSPAMGSNDAITEKGAASRLVMRAQQEPESQTTNPPAPAHEPAPPSPTQAQNHHPAPAPALVDDDSDSSFTPDSAGTTGAGTSAGAASKPVQAEVGSFSSAPGQGAIQVGANSSAVPAVPPVSPSQPQPDAATDKVNALPDGDVTLNSRNGSPFIPGSGPRPDSPPVIALPATSPMAPEDSQLPLVPGSKMTPPRNNKSGQQKGRPRRPQGFGQPGPAPAANMGPRRMKGKDGNPPFQPHFDGNARPM